MLSQQLLMHFDKWRAYYRPPMLMLGAQESTVVGYPTARQWFRQFVGDRYDDLDMADGSLKLDLNGDLVELSGKYATVFDLGTIEHVWDVHAAYVNALRAVAVGGRFLAHSPVGGWVDQQGRFNHGLHLTRAEAILEFATKNGFAVEEHWFSRFKHRGIVLWLRARKVRHIEDAAGFKAPYRLRGLSQQGYTVA